MPFLTRASASHHLPPFFLFSLLIFLLTLEPGLPQGTITVIPDHHDGLYSLGEKVTWTLQSKGDPSSSGSLTYTIKKDGQVPVAQGSVDLSSGSTTLSASREEPGALVLQVTSSKQPNKPIAAGGVVYDWKNLKAALPAPPDFDEFWNSKLKELSEVPINPLLEKGEGGGVEYYKVTLDNIRGTHVQGQLSRPTEDKKYPALLMLQYAGVYPLKKHEVIMEARKGWLALNISAHDLAIDQPDSFYEQKKNGDLKDYIFKGSENREETYFLRMFLGCVRAAEYLTSRPDWDGKTLVVVGASQGGLQSFATAALFKKTSALMTCVPAGCDALGPLAQPPRAFGWPYWLSSWVKDRDLQKVQQSAPYFDAIHFAERMNCPALISVGLLDDTSRPAGVIATYNAIKSPKELVIMTKSDHHGHGGAQDLHNRRAAEWKTAIQSGKDLPIPSSGISVDPIGN